MKTLIALLFIAALPLMGQGRWISEKEYLKILRSDIYEVKADPSKVIVAIEEWLDTQKYFKITKKEVKKEDGYIDSYKIDCDASSEKKEHKGYVLGMKDEIRKRVWFVPDTTILNAYKRYADSTNFSQREFSVDFSVYISSKTKKTTISPYLETPLWFEHTGNKQIDEFLLENSLGFILVEPIAECKKYVLDYLKKNK